MFDGTLSGCGDDDGPLRDAAATRACRYRVRSPCRETVQHDGADVFIATTFITDSVPPTCRTRTSPTMLPPPKTRTPKTRKAAGEAPCVGASASHDEA